MVKEKKNKIIKHTYGAFAIEREETTGKIKNELMPNLDVQYFSPKNIFVFLADPPFLL